MQAIDTGDSRLLYAVFDFPTMFVGHNTAFGTNSAVAFTEWDISGYPTVPLVNDWIIGSTGIDRYYPAADSRIDHEKDMVYLGLQLDDQCRVALRRHPQVEHLHVLRGRRNRPAKRRRDLPAARQPGKATVGVTTWMRVATRTQSASGSEASSSPR